MADTLLLEKRHGPVQQSSQLARFTAPDLARLAEAKVLRDDRRYERVNGLFILG